VNEELKGDPKGKCVIECLKALPDVNYAIMCDGSGKIPYEQVVDIFRFLISDSRLACVMGNRIRNKSISNERYLIERFEVFLLCKFFKHDKPIPDGQCGLWGFKIGEIKTDNSKYEKIKLTATGYEIELDLLSEVIGKGLQYAFLDIVLPAKNDGITSSFKYDNNMSKMKALFKKYDRLEFFVPEFLDRFEKTQDFIDLVKNNAIADFWRRYKTDLLSVVRQESEKS